MADTPDTNNVHPLPDSEVPGGLTMRQRKILETIIEKIEDLGYPPSIRDLLESSGLQSVSSVTYQLTSLERLGYLRRSGGVARGIEILRRPDGSYLSDAVSGAAPIVQADENSVSIPLLGRIAAGPGVLATENVESVMSLPRELTGFGELFMLSVTGDSMIDAGIFDGDFVVVRSQATANNGELVAALINDDEATVKTFKKRDGQIWLMPHNPAYEPIDGNNCIIMGIVVTVLRKV
jgi:repressor LexA